MTFTLPGFSTVKRDGIELSGTFVATVNGDLRVGALEETITVTGETPIVDVQSARTQQTVSKDVLAAIPTSRNAGGIQALIPGMNSETDSGGITGMMTGGAGTIHGGRGDDSRIMRTASNMGWAGGSGGGGNMPQVSSAQEVVLTTSGGLGEAETDGVVLNVIPREGSNTFSGQFGVSGANGALQGSNYTQELKDAGLRSPQELISVYDVNPMGGGRIIRDKLWFYTTYRADRVGPRRAGHVVSTRTRATRTPGRSDFDKSQPAFTDTLERQGTVRLTWQATPRNKFNIQWSEQFNSSNDEGRRHGDADDRGDRAGRCTSRRASRTPPGRRPCPAGCCWRPAGAMYQARYRVAHRGTTAPTTPNMIRVQEQAATIPNLAYPRRHRRQFTRH